MGREARVEREEPKGNNWREQPELRALFYQSPGRRSEDGSLEPVMLVNTETGERKMSGVGFRSGTQVVMSDGSFRRLSVRRVPGISGRQRRNYRKQLNRLAKLPNKPIAAVGTSDAVTSVDQSNSIVNSNQE